MPAAAAQAVSRRPATLRTPPPWAAPEGPLRFECVAQARLQEGWLPGQPGPEAPQTLPILKAEPLQSLQQGQQELLGCSCHAASVIARRRG